MRDNILETVNVSLSHSAAFSRSEVIMFVSGIVSLVVEELGFREEPGFLKVNLLGAILDRQLALDILNQEKAREVLVYLAFLLGAGGPLCPRIIIDGREFRGRIKTRLRIEENFYRLPLTEIDYGDWAMGGTF